MNDQLRRNIEQFIVDYENQLNDIDNMNIATTASFLETAVDLLTKVIENEP